MIRLCHCNRARNSRRTCKKAGVDGTLKVIEGGGHGGKGFNTPEDRQQIFDFFAKYLKPQT